jgi:hypothetical protein
LDQWFWRSTKCKVYRQTDGQPAFNSGANTTAEKDKEIENKTHRI